jgi:hypothetical protein
MSLRVPLAFGLVLLTAACFTGAPDHAPTEGSWVGTITTEGDITTVLNVSGSVWGGTATLVEELSIGVDEGAPEYMLGPARTTWDSGDRIFVPDMSVPAVRVYDGDGRYLGDVGRSGPGPGEYEYPFAVVQLDDDRIYVTNASSEWVDVFAPDFTFIERWAPSPEQMSAPGSYLVHTLVPDDEGRLWMRYWEYDLALPDNMDRREGWRPMSDEGLGPPRWRPPIEAVDLRSCMRPDCSSYLSVPFAPFPSFALAPSGDIIGGAGDEYRFEIHGRDGSVTHVRRTVDPVMLSDEEWDYWMQRQRAEGLSRNPDWQATWGDAVPRHKPAFRNIYVSRDGNIFVVREGASRRLSGCTEDPRPGDRDFVACWESAQVWDYFAPDGRYLGEIEAPPERMRWIPVLDGNRITMMVEDDAGTLMAKRYRMMPPGEEGR